MEIHDYPSKLLQEAVGEFAKLPGIGEKTALRLVLYLLDQAEENVTHFGNTLIKLRKETSYCKECNNITEGELCSICADNNRDHGTICVVENVRDLMAIENTHQYTGVYHVIGGLISPIEGKGPSDLKLSRLENKIASKPVQEVILALSTTMEGDTTNYFLYKKLKQYNIKISAIARGVSLGDELEYADEVTLGSSIKNRHPFENSIAT